MRVRTSAPDCLEDVLADLGFAVIGDDRPKSMLSRGIDLGWFGWQVGQVLKPGNSVAPR